MAALTLGTWIITMLLGAYLWTFTLDTGKPGSAARATRLPPLMLFVHPVLAGSGFAVYLAFMYERHPGLAWTSFGFLLATAMGGHLLMLHTSLHRGKVQTPVRVATPASLPAEAHAAMEAQLARREPGDEAFVEDLMPSAARHVHHAIAMVTLVLLLVVAIRAT
ncbi:hypothetical protein [Nocardioides sp. SYSU D00038]|uniref:hypothetical protein n=1 Tax=Nocardioides sp. SYSU D00038 TaxID=2812554 RepID=UPI00196797D5|nr:hypothetical protein [Nocardioides sp. SYSU D00038]